MSELALRDHVGIDLILDLERAGAITATALDLPADLSWDQYEAFGRMLGFLGRSVQWWVAEWLIFGEAAYGERYAQAAEATGYSHGQLLNLAYVGRNVPRSRRVPGLSFTAHKLVAPLAPAEQKKWLERAAEESLSSRELGEALRDAGEAEVRERPDWTPGIEAAFAKAGSEALLVLDAARSVWRAGQPDGNGQVLVPVDQWARLGAALGEPE